MLPSFEKNVENIINGTPINTVDIVLDNIAVSISNLCDKYSNIKMLDIVNNELVANDNERENKEIMKLASKILNELLTMNIDTECIKKYALMCIKLRDQIVEEEEELQEDTYEIKFIKKIIDYGKKTKNDKFLADIFEYLYFSTFYCIYNKSKSCIDKEFEELSQLGLTESVENFNDRMEELYSAKIIN